MPSNQSEFSSSPQRKSQSAKRSPQKSKTKAGSATQNRKKSSIKIRTDVESSGMIRTRMFRLIFSSSIIGYCLSFFFHTTVLTVLAFITYSEIGQTALNTIITETEDLENIFTDTVDTKIEVAGIDNEQLNQPEIEVVDVPLDIKLPDLSHQLSENLLNDIGRGEGDKAGDGKENGNGKGKQFLFKMPTADKVVTKGSFTAWTEPADPKPGQVYFIIIQIKLPKRLKRYRLSDLSGLVVGTDDYIQDIPGRYKKKYLPVKNHITQYFVMVPGAQELVEDTITLESKLLNEKQTLRIIF